MPTLVGLSRWQFAITVMFHMTFPAITVGLSIFLRVVYGRYWRTGKAVYLQMFRFWRRIFAVGFIGDNIHIGRPAASRAEVECAVVAAGLADVAVTPSSTVPSTPCAR